MTWIFKAASPRQVSSLPHTLRIIDHVTLAVLRVTITAGAAAVGQVQQLKVQTLFAAAVTDEAMKKSTAETWRSMDHCCQGSEELPDRQRKKVMENYIKFYSTAPPHPSIDRSCVHQLRDFRSSRNMTIDQVVQNYNWEGFKHGRRLGWI